MAEEKNKRKGREKASDKEKGKVERKREWCGTRSFRFSVRFGFTGLVPSKA